MADNIDDDNFDIDIYGDGGEGQGYSQDAPTEAVNRGESTEPPMDTTGAAPDSTANGSPQVQPTNPADEQKEVQEDHGAAQKISSTDESGSDPVHLPKQAPQTQGLKRKDGTDDRVIDPGSTSALFVSDLQWWVNDDDVRGWANQSECEDELEEVTFSEHKVNGKSKGQAYVLFKTPQAATAVKHKIESFGEGQQYTKKFAVSYTNPYTNPFKTLPKDGPMRNSGPANNSRSGSGAYGGPQNSGYNSGGYRGRGGGGFNNRGGVNNNTVGGYNRGGFQSSMRGGFQGGMGGFQGSAMGVMQPYGGLQNRGGMAGGMSMGMRGGRGGMGNGMMGMPMGGMNMSAMGAMGLGMPMATGMGMQGMPNFRHESTFNASQLHGQTASPVQSANSSTHTSWGPAPPSVSTNGHKPFAASSGVAQPPNMSGGHITRTKDSLGSAWAGYTQYSTPLHATFPSSAAAFNTVARPQQSAMLKRTSFDTGNQTHFNPAFFPQQQGLQSPSSDSNWGNPHGAKRTRQE